MYFNSILSTAFFLWVLLQPVLARPTLPFGGNRRRKSILIRPPGHASLPNIANVTASAAAFNLKLNDIQGDILVGMKKKKEKFIFFGINDPQTFRVGLKNVSDLITTTTQLLDESKQPQAMINLAFSQTGLNTLGITDSIGDSAFSTGQFADAEALGDPGTDNWVAAFKGRNVHGVFLVASDSTDLVASEWASVKSLLGSSVTELYDLDGQTRPGDQEGHEHFGYLDGVSQPGINGFTVDPVPGQTNIDPGIIILGLQGDSVQRPSWAKGGSFLVFRQLAQLVPEFNTFLANNPIEMPGLTDQQGSELLGARMIGRWKSGAPVDLAPLVDDPDLGRNPFRNNDFNFTQPDIAPGQSRCPFSSHVRKTNPRSDFNPENTQNRIMRAGIPYGPEVDSVEAAFNQTRSERGLAFVSYQSNIAKGFRFQQQAWANNPNFFPGKNPGFDPIIGANAGQPRVVSGLDPSNPQKEMTLLLDFVQSRGGEYFFAPSVSAIKNVLSN